MKLPLLLLGATLTFARPAFAQLTVINPTDQPVSLALGFYVDKGLWKGWNTKGWLTLAPHDSLTELPAGINGNCFCYFVRVPGSDWHDTGRYPLFLHPTDAFAIAGAANDAPLTLNQNSRKAGFAKVDLPAGQRAYRLRLPPPNCTRGGVRTGSWQVYLDRDKEEVTQPDQASYLRRVTYQQGVPTGLVRDYTYPSGVLQWDGKLLREHPAVFQGTCVSYDEAGHKREEGLYQQGQLTGSVHRWDAAGQPVAAAAKKYRTVQVLQPQQGYLVSYFNPGQSRTVIPVTLPAGTVAWYYEFAAFREPAQLQAARVRFKLATELAQLVDNTGIANLLATSLTQPPGGNICNVYLLQDATQSDRFQNKQQFSYLREGTRSSLTSAVVPVLAGSGANSPVYLGLHNPDNLYGIHYALEVLAVVEEVGQ
ncbi:MAG: hypothetical protein ACRYFX_17735 [Janthinobacterium lividum]